MKELAPVTEAEEYNIMYKGEYNQKAILVDDYIYLNMNVINENLRSLSDYNVILTSFGPKLSSIGVYMAYLNHPEIALCYVPCKEYNINYKLSDMKKDLKSLYSKYTWLKEVDSISLRTTLENLDAAYINYYEKRNELPKYKKKSINGSYTTSCIRSSYKNVNYSNIKVDIKNKIIKLPKLKEVKIRGYRNLESFPYKIVNATISKEADKYYVSVLAQDYIKTLPKTNNIVGIDLGVKTLVITSEGKKYTSLNLIQKYEKKIAGLNRWLSRCKVGSKNRYKVRIKLQRVYKKMRNARKYYTDVITKKLIEENDYIISENLKIKDMIQSSANKLSKYITSSSLREIIRKLEYKSKWYGRTYLQVNSYYPSSQRCNLCGSINKEVKDLRIRNWKCKECGMNHDRDINASLNILEKGIEIITSKEYKVIKVIS